MLQRSQEPKFRSRAVVAAVMLAAQEAAVPGLPEARPSATAYALLGGAPHSQPSVPPTRKDTEITSTLRMLLTPEKKNVRIFRFQHWQYWKNGCRDSHLHKRRHPRWLHALQLTMRLEYM